MLLPLVAACGAAADDEVGFGTPEVRRLAEPELAKHFTGEPALLAARLSSLPNGCLVAVVDGVEHVVFWPDGTEARDESGDDGHLVTVTLPGGATLTATRSSGSEFTAEGRVSDVAGVISAEPSGPPDDFVGSYLGFCGVDAAAVAFDDASSFSVTG